MKTLPKLFDQTSLKLSVLLKNPRGKGGREKSIHINFQRIHDLFVVSLISSQPCIKTPSVSGSRNRRQVKPRNKNRHPNHFSLSLSLSLSLSCLLHFVQARHHRRNGFSQQYGKMFDDPIDHGPLSVLRGEMLHPALLCVCVCARARVVQGETCEPFITGDQARGATYITWKLGKLKMMENFH